MGWKSGRKRVGPEIGKCRIPFHVMQVKYKEGIKHATAISDPPELKRVKENQKNISNVHYKEKLGKATDVSVTPEMKRVKKNQENISSASGLDFSIF
uniref:Uncharacterized protein n=1 Tax=Ornithorhynchus anatinus TaxID=9258 RepID=A0A6I8PK33_ORNAN